MKNIYVELTEIKRDKVMDIVIILKRQEMFTEKSPLFVRPMIEYVRLPYNAF